MTNMQGFFFSSFLPSLPIPHTPTHTHTHTQTHIEISTPPHTHACIAYVAVQQLSTFDLFYWVLQYRHFDLRGDSLCIFVLRVCLCVRVCVCACVAICVCLCV